MTRKGKKKKDGKEEKKKEWLKNRFIKTHPLTTIVRLFPQWDNHRCKRCLRCMRCRVDEDTNRGGDYDDRKEGSSGKQGTKAEQLFLIWYGIAWPVSVAMLLFWIKSARLWGRDKGFFLSLWASYPFGPRRTQ